MARTNGNGNATPRGRSASKRGTSRPSNTKAKTASKAAPKGASAGSLSNEIWGIVIGAIAVALLIALLSGEKAPVASFIAIALKLAFGLGAFFVPVAALVWAASFFVDDLPADKGRVGIGLLVSFLALITMFALAGPRLVVPAPTRAVAAVQNLSLMAHGGWVGGVIALPLSSLLGQWIPWVIALAAFLAGLVVAGISVTRLVESGRATIEARRDARLAEERPAGRGRAPAGPTLVLDQQGYSDRGTVALDVAAAPTDGSAEPNGRKRKKKEAAEDRPTLPVGSVTVAPLAMEGFELPPLSMLARSSHTAAAHQATEKELRALADTIVRTLGNFEIPAEVVNWTAGPTVTLFRVRIAEGVKVNKVNLLNENIAMALAAPSIRIMAPIPGESFIGIEVPNERRSMVTLGDVLATADTSSTSPLMLAIGKDVVGESVVVDLAEMPHLLIAGATGTGKSVCINALLTSILMRATPSEVRLILIDPKRIELSSYNGLPHLYVPVVTEPKQAASALAWAVAEMELRLKRLQDAGARNIGQYNSMVIAGKTPEGMEPMPYIVIVIDELADLMMVAAREVEESIVRIAQLARAAGIHLIVATQRPSTDIITGLIKTNITHRIAFAVASSVDSRVILDTSGAERLTSKGDMLFGTPQWAKPRRLQGPFVSTDETEAVVEYLRSQAEPDYHEEILSIQVSGSGGGGGASDDADPMLWEAADIVVTSGLGSTSMLQRRLSVGYARAGRIMDMLEAKGVVGPPNGSKPRDVLVDVEELESIKAFERQDERDGY